MKFNDITLEFRGSVAVLTLNRPDKLNSFTWEMHQEVKSAFDEIEAGDARAMLLTGNGRGFCAGQDLGDPQLRLDGDDHDIGETLEENFNPLVKRIRALPLPVICAVNGVAAGAGANVALACDIILAARSASFLQAFARIGLIPDAGGTWHLTRLLGEARAKGLAMLAEPLPAETAEKWGMIWKVCDDNTLMDEAMALADKLAGQPTRAFALCKQAIHAAGAGEFASHLDLERDLQRQASQTDDFREGVRAFLEKRKASFKGT